MNLVPVVVFAIAASLGAYMASLHFEERWPALALALTHVAVAVTVIGGGLAGVSAAFCLAAAERTVVPLERRALGEGATDFTTAKVTAGHDPI